MPTWLSGRSASRSAAPTTRTAARTGAPNEATLRRTRSNVKPARPLVAAGFAFSVRQRTLCPGEVRPTNHGAGVANRRASGDEPQPAVDVRAAATCRIVRHDAQPRDIIHNFLTSGAETIG